MITGWTVLKWVLTIVAVVDNAWALYKYRPWVRAPFTNRTKGVLTDQQIRTIWANAAIALSIASFPLAPGADDEQMHAPDPRAVKLGPRAIIVELHEDTAGSKGWMDGGHTYPVVGLTTANWLRPLRVQIARSCAAEVLAYEFQNAQLYLLGYDISGR